MDIPLPRKQTFQVRKLLVPSCSRPRTTGARICLDKSSHGKSERMGGGLVEAEACLGHAPARMPVHRSSLLTIAFWPTTIASHSLDSQPATLPFLSPPHPPAVHPPFKSKAQACLRDLLDFSGSQKLPLPSLPLPEHKVPTVPVLGPYVGPGIRPAPGSQPLSLKPKYWSTSFLRPLNPYFGLTLSRADSAKLASLSQDCSRR